MPDTYWYPAPWPALPDTLNFSICQEVKFLVEGKTPGVPGHFLGIRGADVQTVEVIVKLIPNPTSWEIIFVNFPRLSLDPDWIRHSHAHFVLENSPRWEVTNPWRSPNLAFQRIDTVLQSASCHYGLPPTVSLVSASPAISFYMLVDIHVRGLDFESIKGKVVGLRAIEQAWAEFVVVMHDDSRAFVGGSQYLYLSVPTAYIQDSTNEFTRAFIPNRSKLASVLEQTSIARPVS